MRYRLSTLLLLSCIFASLLSLVLRAWEVAELQGQLRKMTDERDYFEREYKSLRFSRWPDSED